MALEELTATRLGDGGEDTAFGPQLLGEAPGANAEDATRRLVNRLLHRPSRGLDELARSGTSGEAERQLRRLFGLAGDDERENGP